MDGGIRRLALWPRLDTSPSATFLDFDARREPALTLTPALSQMEREKIDSACPAFRSPIGVPGSPSMAGMARRGWRDSPAGPVAKAGYKPQRYMFVSRLREVRGPTAHSLSINIHESRATVAASIGSPMTPSRRFKSNARS